MVQDVHHVVALLGEGGGVVSVERKGKRRHWTALLSEVPRSDTAHMLKEARWGKKEPWRARVLWKWVLESLLPPPTP